MRYSLGFQRNMENYYTIEDVIYLNIHPLVDYDHSKGRSLDQVLDEFINKILLSNGEYITPLGFFNKELVRNDGMTLLDHNKLDLVKKIITDLHFKTLKCKKVDWVHEKLPYVDFNEKNLYIRYGNVELRALEFILRNPSALSEIIDKLLTQMDNEEYIYASMVSGDAKWLTAADGAFNLKALMHTAGFYFSPDKSGAIEDLNSWATKYFKALLTPNSFLFPYPDCYPFFLNVWKELVENEPAFKPNYLYFPSPKLFFEMLKHKTVLILTPFKDLMERMVSELRLKNLYTDFEISDIKFIFVQAPVSLYPNRPGSGWHSTFLAMAQSIDEIIIREGVDLFTASCGAYGLPISSHVYQKHCLTTVYYGNYLNSLMGIRQQCSIDFEAGKINDNLRLSSDLRGRFEGVERVDGGRYV